MKIGSKYSIDNTIVTVVENTGTRIYFDLPHQEFYISNNGIAILVFKRLLREGKIVPMHELSDMKIGQHFWAEYSGEIAVFMKTAEDTYTVCGGWEGEFCEDDFTFIENIGEPKGFETMKKYYA